MRFLAAASELYPLIKTGALGDLAGACRRPRPLGIEMRCLLPAYPVVLETLAASGGPGRVDTQLPGLPGGPGRVRLVDHRSLAVYLLETAFAGMAAAWRGRVACVFGYAEPLAHLLQGGSA